MQDDLHYFPLSRFQTAGAQKILWAGPLFLKIKFYWHTYAHHLHIIYSCLHSTRAKFRSCNRHYLVNKGHHNY